MDVIVSRGFGSYEVFAATVENAKEILSWQTVSSDVIDTADRFNADFTYCTYEKIVRILNKILDESVDTVVLLDRQTKEPVLTATKEAKQELVMYLYQKGMPIKSIPTYDFKNKCNVNDLSFMTCYHNIPLFDDWIADQAKKYHTITNDKWKETATERGKIRYILDFVNELCHRDEEYDIVTIKDVAG